MSERPPRVRRRRAPRPKLDDSVPSPCVKRCALDSVSGLCSGCLRSADEIREWMILSREEKLAVLENIKGRK
ncbi:MAG: DUF1289 domain-containing protein [Proteobacteria bacterium]|nr:MAG: DUF1289 domain-containing protein [Pseudomonadota bacterium]